jgi:hypothetical protein
MSSYRQYLASIATLAMILTACGSDDSSATLGQAPSNGASNEVDESEVDESEVDESEVDLEGLDLDELSDAVGNLPGVSGECEALLELFISIGGVFLGGGDVSSFDAGALAGLPGDVQQDAELVAGTLAQFSNALQDLGVDFSDPASFAALSESQTEEFRALSDSLDTEEFTAASDSLSAYGEQECDEFSPG